MGEGGIPTSASRRSRWLGVFYSFLIPGAGQFLAGKRIQGVIWHVSLLLLRFTAFAVAPLMVPVGLFIAFLLLLLSFVLWIVMLVDSYRPVPEGHWYFLIPIVILGVFVWRGERLLTLKAAQAFKIPSAGMSPTLEPGDRIFAVKHPYFLSDPERGDVIVFHPPDPIFDPAKPYYVKRIAGLPGERISIKEGRLFADGREVNDPPIFEELELLPAPQPKGLPPPPEAHVVPKGEYFVIGDNSRRSFDSRHWGTVARENIVGKVTMIWWPPERVGSIE